jgi:hypothetical protein
MSCVAHPHTSISLPAIQALSLDPILFKQVPAIDTVIAKLASFIDSAESWPSSGQSKDQVKNTLTALVAPYLKARFSATSSGSSVSITQPTLVAWVRATSAIIAALPTPSLFPLVDLWRLALIDPSVATQWVSSSSGLDPTSSITSKAAEALQRSDSRNYILTVLRFLANQFSSPALGQKLLASTRTALTALLVPSLLHTDGAVRTAAASLAFNVAALIQKGRVEKVRGNVLPHAVAEDEDWEVEAVSAIIEALDREVSSEEVG